MSSEECLVYQASFLNNLTSLSLNSYLDLIFATKRWWSSFSIRVLFYGHWQITGKQGKGGNYPLFHSTTSTRWRTFRHLFATLYVRWLSHIFNRNACIYQAATRWDLPPYRITIWLIDDVMLIFVCLLVDLILGFVTAIWHKKPVDSNSQRLSSLSYKRTN